MPTRSSTSPKLEFEAGELAAARRWWERYLELDARSEWARQGGAGDPVRGPADARGTPGDGLPLRRAGGRGGDGAAGARRGRADGFAGDDGGGAGAGGGGARGWRASSSATWRGGAQGVRKPPPRAETRDAGVSRGGGGAGGAGAAGDRRQVDGRAGGEHGGGRAQGRSRGSSASAIRSIRRGGRSSSGPRHLEGLATPALIVQGTRDPSGRGRRWRAIALSPAIRVLWLEDGDHDLRPRKAVSGFTAADAPATHGAGGGGVGGRLRLTRRLMRIATFNVNNVVKRLANLLEWLAETAPDVVCLQELKAHGRRLSGGGAGGGGLRRGLARAADVERGGDPLAGRRAGHDAGRAAGRSGRRAGALHRGGGGGGAGRLPLCAERQPAAGAEVRLQAGLARAASRRMRRSCWRRGCRWCWPGTTTSCRSRGTSIRPPPTTGTR